MTATGAAGLERLLQGHLIRDCVLRAASGADAEDEAVVAACFWPEATVRHGSTPPWSPPESRARWRRAAENLTTTQHLVFNHWSDGMRCETYWIAAFAAASTVAEESVLPFCSGVPAAHVALQGGRWLDRFESRNGEWRIAEREVAVDWIATLPGTSTMTAPSPTVAPAHPSLDHLLAVEAAKDCLSRQPLITERLGAGASPLAVHLTDVRASVDGTAGTAQAEFVAVRRAPRSTGQTAVDLVGGACRLILQHGAQGWTVAGADVSIRWIAVAPAPFLAGFIAATQRSAPPRRSLGDTRSTCAAELRERDAIRDCLARYARGVDRLDRPLVESAFAGAPPRAVEAIFAQAAQRPVQNHCIGNLRIALRGDAALAEARYLTAIGYAQGSGHGLPGGTPSPHDVNLVGGRYAIRLVRHADGRWAMTDRGNVGEWHAVLDGSGRERFQRRTGNAVSRGPAVPLS